MRRLMIVLAALAALAAGWWLGSPYWTLHQMKSAAEQGDTARLSTYIDYPAVRENLKGQVRRAILKDASTNEEGKGLAALGSAIAGALIDPVIDTMVSPEGLQAAFAEREAQSTLRPGPHLPAAPDKPVVTHDGLDTFKVRDRRHDQGSLLFRRVGLGWKLVGFELPPKAAS
jgi:hypothetical protein